MFHLPIQFTVVTADECFRSHFLPCFSTDGVRKGICFANFLHRFLLRIKHKVKASVALNDHVPNGINAVRIPRDGEVWSEKIVFVHISFRELRFPKGMNAFLTTRGPIIIRRSVQRDMKIGNIMRSLPHTGEFYAGFETQKLLPIVGIAMPHSKAQFPGPANISLRTKLRLRPIEREACTWSRIPKFQIRLGQCNVSLLRQ